MVDKRKTIITYGTFDLFHKGHLNILKRAKSLGNYLIVGVSTDNFNKIKGKKSLIPFKDRKDIIKSLKFVDKVIEERTWGQKKEDIIKYNVDLLVMGDDWKDSKEFNSIKKKVKIRFLKRTKRVSTSLVRNILGQIENLNNLMKNFK